MEPTEGNGSGAKAMVKQRSEGVAPTSASSATASAHAASQVRDAIRDEGLAAGAGAYSHRPGESKFHHRSMYGGGIALEKGSNSGRMSVPGPRERLERMEGLVPMERRMYMDRPGVVAQQYEDPRYMDEMYEQEHDYIQNSHGFIGAVWGRELSFPPHPEAWGNFPELRVRVTDRY
eukprot:224577-Amorphochlora_amoeboformis.AAC.1